MGATAVASRVKPMKPPDVGIDLKGQEKGHQPSAHANQNPLDAAQCIQIQPADNPEKYERYANSHEHCDNHDVEIAFQSILASALRRNNRWDVRL